MVAFWSTEPPTFGQSVNVVFALLLVLSTSPSMRSWSAIAAIAGMAISSAHVIKRSVTLLLSLVRISSCLPSEFPYTSRSLKSIPIYLLLLIGSKFHGFGRLLSCSNYRLSGREDRALCQVAIL